MEQYIWHEKTSVILTSATLTANEGFDYLRNRLNADEADEIQLGSPFDYETAALLYLANDIPEPNDANGYQRAVEQIPGPPGQSHRRAHAGAVHLLRPAETHLPVHHRPAGRSRASPSTSRAKAPRPTPCWRPSARPIKPCCWARAPSGKGVDIPGEALSVLVIVKLPFDVPSDPIIAARSETFEDPFNEYHLPEAILRFRQGFGRLIRTQSDRGIVAILDRRILTKRYGRAFIESLPQLQIQDWPAAGPALRRLALAKFVDFTGRSGATRSLNPPPTNRIHPDARGAEALPPCPAPTITPPGGVARL